MTVGEESSVVEPAFDYIVLDSGPLINNTFPATLARNFVTTNGVIGELKDEATRERLARLPFVLQTKTPSAAALAFVRAFAQKTGDAAVLSSVDLGVVALVVDLEWRENGKDSITATPQSPRVHQGGSELRKSEAKPKTDKPDAQGDAKDKEQKKDRGARDRDKPKAKANAKEDDEDAGEWITAENIDFFKNKALCKTPQTIPVVVKTDAGVTKKSIGCMSTDFAVQNLLLQMKLKLYSNDGRRIRQAKSWLLRCHACYWTTRQMERRFCDRCGNPTLLRTSYMVDANGNTHLFLKADFQYKVRGSKAPLPMPQPGRGGNSLLLREDQKEYVQAMHSYRVLKKKSEKLAADVDSVDDRLAAVFSGMSIHKNVNSLDVSLPTIGFGRRNPNQARRRV